VANALRGRKGGIQPALSARQNTHGPAPPKPHAAGSWQLAVGSWQSDHVGFEGGACGHYIFFKHAGFLIPIKGRVSDSWQLQLAVGSWQFFLFKKKQKQGPFNTQRRAFVFISSNWLVGQKIFVYRFITRCLCAGVQTPV